MQNEINLQRQTTRNPIIPNYTAPEDTFDLNKTASAPPGFKVVVHEKPYTRRTWSPHGSGGWYIGPSMEHFRCHQVYVNATKSEISGDKVELFPHHTKNTIHVFTSLRLSGCCRLNGGITTSKSWGTICINRVNPVVRPKTTGNPLSSPSKQTWCNSKGETDIKGYRTTMGGNSCTTKVVAKNKYTISKGGYAQSPCTHYTIKSHHRIKG